MNSITYSILFWLFISGSILGTLLEGVYCLIKRGQWEKHTVTIWGPFCIIYGIGAIILYVGAVLTEYSHVIWQFAVFASTTTIAEYVCGMLLKYGLHMRAWDYSDCAFNISGLICVKMTVIWGVLGVIFKKYCMPYIKSLIKVLDCGLIQAVTCIFSALMALNLFLTTLCIVRWSRRHLGHPPRNAVEEYIDVKYGDNRMKHRFCEWSFIDN